MTVNKGVIIIGSLSQSLINFRGELIRQLISKGCNVIAMAPNKLKPPIADINKLGASSEIYLSLVAIYTLSFALQVFIKFILFTRKGFYTRRS